MNFIINIALFVLFTTPPIFQLIFGSKATNPSYSYKLWKISLISLLGLVLTTLLNVSLMTQIIKHAGSRDGLPVLAILMLEAIIGSILVIMIIIQFFVKHRRKITLR